MRKGDKLVNGTTPFEQKWGITAKELAEQDNVSTPAIHMRVNLYGTPFQRKKKPTIMEGKYGKTMFEIAEDQGVHPMTIIRREELYGDVYRQASYTHPTKGTKLVDDPKWRKDARKVFWLHPSHPDYERARKGEHNA